MNSNTLRKFSLSSEYFSHFIIIIDIYDDNLKSYKSMKQLIDECKVILYHYINDLDFSNKERLKKEFKKQDLWILENMLDENDNNLNKDFLLNELLNRQFDYHDYDINILINDKSKYENIYYICDHCH